MYTYLFTFLIFFFGIFVSNAGTVNFSPEFVNAIAHNKEIKVPISFVTTAKKNNESSLRLVGKLIRAYIIARLVFFIYICWQRKSTEEPSFITSWIPGITTFKEYSYYTACFVQSIPLLIRMIALWYGTRCFETFMTQ